MQRPTALIDCGFQHKDNNFPQIEFSSVQFSHLVVSTSLRPYELQHARPPCPSPSPGVHSDSRPLSWWCHPAISTSVVPFSSCPQSLPASESFPVSQLFTWRGQSTGISAFILSGVISPLISSSILGTYWPGEFLFQYLVILPFHTIHEVLKARILKWLAIPFSSVVPLKKKNKKPIQSKIVRRPKEDI